MTARARRAQEGSKQRAPRASKRENNGRVLEPEQIKNANKEGSRRERTAQLELDRSLVDSFEVWLLACINSCSSSSLLNQLATLAAH